MVFWGFLGSASKNLPAMQEMQETFYPRVGKMPWKKSA